MSRTSSRSLWAQKLAGLATPAGGVVPVGAATSGASAPARAVKARIAPPCMRKPFTGVVLGVDPSLRGTGLAVVAFDAGKPPRLCASRTLELKAKYDQHACLGEIHKAVADMIAAWPVTHAAYEETIYVQNFKTAQILGAARGAAIAAAVIMGKPVFEYAPLRVKQAVVGTGAAKKEQVAGMIRQLLALPHELPFDESDAAAVALCHAFTWRAEV